MVRKRSPIASRNRSVEQFEPKTTDEKNINFSLKYFHDIDDIGQSLKTWSEDEQKPLLGLMQKVLHISRLTTAQAFQDKSIKIYGDFPATHVSDFKCPPALTNEKQWGVISHIGGQKSRVAGFLRGNTFYMVYLDKDHRFWKSAKR